MAAIYRIYNIANGKSYIGRSNRPYQRIARHLTPEWSSGSPGVRQDLLELPPESWQWEILADDSDYPGFSIEELERHFIRAYNSRANGYNIMPGGEGFYSGPTQNETHRSRFEPTKMRDRIIRGIADYQRRHKAEQARQQAIIAEHGSLEAYREHQKRQWEIWQREAARKSARRENRGCLGAIAGFAVLFGIALSHAGGC